MLLVAQSHCDTESEVALTDLTINRQRLTLLRYIDAGLVSLTRSGCIVRKAPKKWGMENIRCDRGVGDMRQAGWVKVGPDGSTYEVTDEGRALMEKHQDLRAQWESVRLPAAQDSDG